MGCSEMIIAKAIASIGIWFVVGPAVAFSLIVVLACAVFAIISNTLKLIAWVAIVSIVAITGAGVYNFVTWATTC